jgi:DNA-binding XRE family transcriptional regulator
MPNRLSHTSILQEPAYWWNTAYVTDIRLLDVFPHRTMKLWQEWRARGYLIDLGFPPLAKAKRKNLLPQSEAEVGELLKVRQQVRRVAASLLRTRRQEAGITQQQMGYALGVSEDVVYKMEAQKTAYAIEDAIVTAVLTGTERTPSEELAAFCEELQFSLRKIFPGKK